MNTRTANMRSVMMSTARLQQQTQSLFHRISRDNLVLFVLLAGLSALMILFIVMPLWAMLTKSVQNAQGEFVGLANFAHYFSSLVSTNS